MSRRRKATTSNELIRENCEWPMTVGEVAKLTGVTPRALQIYDERGLLCPTRSGEGVANNRKLYMPEDIDRLKQIVVLKDYGFDLKEMAPILDGEVDVLEALDERLKELQAEENYLKSLILFARYAQVVGEDIFETLAFGTSEVDAFAEFLRESPVYNDRQQRWENFDDAGFERLWDDFGAIVLRFLSITGDNTFEQVEEAVAQLRAWFGENYFEIDDLDLLAPWVMFEDGSEEAEFAQAISDESTPGFLQASVFLVWLKKMLAELSARIGAQTAEESVPGNLTENEVVRLVHFVCQAVGYPVMEVAQLDREKWEDMVEFFTTILSYLIAAIDDDELMEEMYHDNQPIIGISCLEQLIDQARALELFA